MRVREYRREQEDDALPGPADELDTARSLAEVETHASLIDQLEDRLKQIAAAFSRLEQGRYGVCEDCGLEMDVKRLEALPFATRCVTCQNARTGVHRGEGGTIEPYNQQWDLPQEMEESSEAPRDETTRMPEEELMVRTERPLGPEEGGLAKPPIVTPRRPRK